MSDVASHPYYSPSPAQLRRIVLAYLCHNCHVNTARVFKKEQRARDIDDGLGPWSTGGLTTGFESGFGSRPIDRDLQTGLPVQPPVPDLTSSTNDGASFQVSIEEDGALRELDVMDPRRATSVAASNVSQLKDADGDDVMTPAPEADGDGDVEDDSEANLEANLDPSLDMTGDIDESTLGTGAHLPSIHIENLMESVEMLPPPGSLNPRGVYASSVDGDGDASMRFVLFKSDEINRDGGDVGDFPYEMFAEVKGAGTVVDDDFEGYLQDIERRKEIRDHILWGRIAEATALLKEHFPTVLNPSLASKARNPFILSDPAVAPPRPEWATVSERMYRTPSAGSRSGYDTGAGATLVSGPGSGSGTWGMNVSLEAANVEVSLLIQSFIEASRSRPLEPPPPPTSYLTPQHAYTPPHSSSSHPAFISTSAIPSSSNPSSSTSSVTPDASKDQRSILQLAKDLAKVSNALPDATDRALVLKELDDNIWPLMAYPRPEELAPAHIARYLMYERRLSLADQVNSAILARLGQEPHTALEYYARSTAVLWNLVHDREITIPSDPKRYPTGARLPTPYAASVSSIPPPISSLSSGGLQGLGPGGLGSLPGVPPGPASSRLFALSGSNVGVSGAATRTETVVAPSFDFARFLDSR